MNKPDDYYTIGALRKERGWSERLIEDLLGEPDRLARKQARRYGRAKYRPAKLYASGRVNIAEQDERFIAYQAKRQRRSQASKRTADRKRAELEAWAHNVPIAVKPLPLDAVYKRSLESREAWETSRGRSNFDGGNAPAGVRARWAVNYVRHELTSYDDTLLQAYGEVGIDRAVAAIRNRVLGEIASVYPELAAECARQRAAGRE